MVWEDLNGNGIQDIGEPGIPGVVLELSDETGAVIATSECDVDGLYEFTDLEAGEYTVCVANDDLNGYVATTDTCYTFVIDQDETCNVEDANFGLMIDETPTTGSIGNYVWLDDNGDGIIDAGENGLANVQVTLLDDSGLSLIHI